jgi:membrane peptidoglycan carboxypeptidase
VRKLGRLIAILAAAAVVVAGATAGAVAVVSGVVTHAASATPIALPPLASSLSEPSVIYANDGTTVLAVLSGAQNRKPVTLSQVSPLIVHAVLDTEDHYFYVHGAIDVPSILRALFHDSSGGGLQGGSDITQQLVKNTYLTDERTLSRKIKEAVLAERVQKRYSRNAILQAYLNTIYLGSNAYGVEAATEEYFNTTAAHVTLAEAALLAGMIQDPNGYNPVYNPLAARTRRAEVLAHMVQYGSITPAQATAANAAPLPTHVTVPKVATGKGYGYYAQVVVDQLLGSSSAPIPLKPNPLGTTYQQRYDALFQGGLKIYTNLSPRMQVDAQSAVNQVINSVGAPYGDTGALAAIDPTSGAVKALVGGPGSGRNSFDLATQAVRQPGSGFKVFTLLTAYEQGYSPKDTIDGTAPCPVPFPGDDDYVLHPPSNAADGEGAGPITIDNATANSINCAFIRLGQKVGLPAIIAQAHNLGLTEHFKPYPSIIIGGQGVTVLQMAAAYATVADDGVYHTPSFIDHITNNQGRVIFRGDHPGRRAVPQQVDREALVDFENVVLHGTGTAAALYGRQAAGKTGTTDNSTDAWFNGMTPQLVASVWMGNPKGDSAQYGMRGVGGLSEVFGGNFPAQAWAAFMNPALAPFPPATFPSPDPSLIPPGHFLPSPGTGGISGTSPNGSTSGYTYNNGYPYNGGTATGGTGTGGTGGTGTGGTGTGGTGQGGGGNGNGNGNGNGLATSPSTG